MTIKYPVVKTTKVDQETANMVTLKAIEKGWSESQVIRKAIVEFCSGDTKETPKGAGEAELKNHGECIHHNDDTTVGK